MASQDLRMCIYSKDLEAIQNIIKTRTNFLNLSVDETVTPLIDAIRSGDVRVVQLLINSGADINHINTNVPHPLLTAIKVRANKIIKLLIDNGVDTSVLPIPDLENDTVNTILECGIDVNIRDRELKTFLYYAVKKGDLESVNTLLKYRADVNIEDINGNYPIHIAIKHNFFDIIKVLVENGAYLNVNNYNIETPLHYSVEYGDYKTVKYLITNGSHIMVKCKRGFTPLHTAIIHNRSVIPLLINNATINVQDINGSTPLHHAINYPCDKDVVDTLLYHKADISIRDNKGENVLDVAMKYVKIPVLKDIIANAVLKKEADQLPSDFLNKISILENKELSDFIKECNREIEDMKRYTIGCNKNILQLCLNTISINFTNNEQLNTLRSQYHRFPIYYMYISRYISDNIKNRNDNNFCSIRNI
ncbi:SWPV2-ORF016 [Shearwaterpox virus]|uniref:SWPV2-ORF016 n=1 Tax=Shearwaterpox virus TaxID=1974596 RepID=A0A1V0QFY3_CNPV|nr:SWPV2-ORF016 [Shearwaterpox virus]QRM15649.1 ankyrin repeat protein [Penguinpox virus 2]QRM15979.1 ankyrin repeat protein [Albatrosspox virus]